MALSIDRKAFIDATASVARILSAKPTNPVLGGVRIEALTSSLQVTFSAYDLEQSVQVILNDIAVDESFSVLVSGRLLAAIAKALPAAPVVTLLPANADVMLLCGKAQFRLPRMNVDEFPVLPIMPGDAGEIDGAELAGAIARVVPMVGNDEAQPAINAVCLDVLSSTRLRLMTTDRLRAALTYVAWKGAESAVGTRLLIPAKGFTELAKAGNGTVNLAVSQDSGLIGVHTDGRRVTTRLLAEKFPNVPGIIPGTIDTFVTVNSDDLRGALNRELLLDDDEYPQVTLTFDPDVLTVRGSGANGSFLEEFTPVSHDGPNLLKTFNTRYLLDALASLNSQQVTLGLTEAYKPVVLHAGAAVDGAPDSKIDADNLQLVMPVAKV